MSVFDMIAIDQLKGANRVTFQAILLVLQDNDLLTADEWKKYQVKATAMVDQQRAEETDG